MASFREQGPTERFEKRRLFRFPVQLPAKLGHGDDDCSICTNLSTSGASFETSLPFHVSERIAVMVTISPNEEPLRMVGQVIWKRPIAVMDAKLRPVEEIGVRFLRSLPSLERFGDDENTGVEPIRKEEEEDEYIFPRRIP
jgi:hypothetical protein